MKEVMRGSPDYNVDIDELKEIESAESKTSTENIESQLLKSVQQQDERAKEEGRILNEAINQGISAFNPDMMFQNLTNNYSMAKKIYGKTLIRLISGYNPDYIKRNIKIPEFRKELKKKLKGRIDELKEKKLLKRDSSIAEKGFKLASLLLYAEELDNIIPKGIFGEKIHKKASHYGERGDFRHYKKGDRYRDIEIKQSLKMAIRRGHKKVMRTDLRTSEMQSKGSAYIIYAVDASGSMKGKKIEMSKKAGIALAYKAIEQKDKVGLIVFGSDIKEKIYPTSNFPMLLEKISRIRASKQTDFRGMLHKSLELFPKGEFTRHLIVITDAMPTVGNEPKKESLVEMANIRNAGITVSLIGINLDREASEFAERFVEIGKGRLQIIRQAEELDKIVLEDYYTFS
ncbi:VWA domain-containing protein [Candidatus Woesearchaeota archaeon]|nr:VWA domain-containing protein [Candidatus Woesearchaeota archaeon]